ncbi:hypothetical protein [Xylella taiwanensis]|uniref:hypothetical protein n=1 Tax=Xylella taiwanensis TaxID=1444770 RepID=UPI0004BAB977
MRRACGVFCVAGGDWGGQVRLFWKSYVRCVLIFLYFTFFITMPLWTVLDAKKPVPERLTFYG